MVTNSISIWLWKIISWIWKLIDKQQCPSPLMQVLCGTCCTLLGKELMDSSGLCVSLGPHVGDSDDCFHLMQPRCVSKVLSSIRRPPWTFGQAVRGIPKNQGFTEGARHWRSLPCSSWTGSYKMLLKQHTSLIFAKMWFLRGFCQKLMSSTLLFLLLFSYYAWWYFVRRQTCLCVKYCAYISLILPKGWIHSSYIAFFWD